MKLLYRTGDYAFIISAMGKLFPDESGQVVTVIEDIKSLGLIMSQ